MSPRRSVASRLSPRRSGVMKAVAREAGHVGREVRKNGIQVGVGDLSMDLHRRDQQGRQRRSPVEVLLHSLTDRRSKD
jgi:hypothetical protein